MIDLLQDMVAFIHFEMPPKTSLFVCGDFNFDLTRPGFMETLPSKEFEIFPKQQERKRPIDFVLVWGRHVNVQSCYQFNPSDPLRKGSNNSNAVELGDTKVEQEDRRQANQGTTNLEEELRLLIERLPKSIQLKIKTEPEAVSKLFTSLVNEEIKDDVGVSVKGITATGEKGLPLTE